MPDDKPKIQVYELYDNDWNVVLFLPMDAPPLEIVEPTKEKALRIAEQLQTLFVDPPEIEVIG